jgi:hypothetical protein
MPPEVTVMGETKQTEKRTHVTKAPLDTGIFFRVKPDRWVFHIKRPLDPKQVELGFFCLMAENLLRNYESTDDDGAGIAVIVPKEIAQRVYNTTDQPAKLYWMVFNDQTNRYGFYPSNGGMEVPDELAREILAYNYRIVVGEIEIPKEVNSNEY